MSNTLHPYYLQQMGIETWLIRQPPTKFESRPIKLMVICDVMDTDTKTIGLLNKMLNSIDLLTEDICFKFSWTDEILQQITSSPPQLLLVMDSAAIKRLLNETTDSFTTLRCKMHDYQGLPFVVSYHPADLLKRPADKKYAYQDLLYIQKTLTQSSC